MADPQDRIKLIPSWKKQIGDEFNKNYMQQLRQFLIHEKKLGKTIFPPGNEMFSALNATPFQDVKVVILGQDPYHGTGQAHGLSFSVRPEVPFPPSLQNIYQELLTDLGIQPANHGCLISWAKQGVLLLNSVLSVEKSRAASHRGKGWEQFTDRVIAELNENHSALVFILWGSDAQKKGAFINTQKHLVLKSPHPSPLAAYRGFFGKRHFSQANQFLQQSGKQPINWSLPSKEEALAMLSENTGNL